MQLARQCVAAAVRQPDVDQGRDDAVTAVAHSLKGLAGGRRFDHAQSQGFQQVHGDHSDQRLILYDEDDTDRCGGIMGNIATQGRLRRGRGGVRRSRYLTSVPPRTRSA